MNERGNEMSERKCSKERKCNWCQEVNVRTAEELKEHACKCRKVTDEKVEKFLSTVEK